MSAVEKLPPADRELVTMRFLHGSSYEELADQRGSTPHSLRAMCSKVVARLRQQLDFPQAREDSDVE
jgi:DNA-directed RNA polymerase specialized sigma24 family protein